MADISQSAENMRTMLAEALNRLRKANSDYFELLEKNVGSSQLPIASQAKEFCSLMQRNATAIFDLGDKLIQSRDISDVVKLQTKFYEDQMKSMAEQARTMGEASMKAATSMFTPKK